MTKPPVLTESLPSMGHLLCRSKPPPSVDAPLQETAKGRPYRDTKSGALGFVRKAINVNSGQNTSYMVP